DRHAGRLSNPSRAGFQHSRSQPFAEARRTSRCPVSGSKNSQVAKPRMFVARSSSAARRNARITGSGSLFRYGVATTAKRGSCAHSDRLAETQERPDRLEVASELEFSHGS